MLKIFSARTTLLASAGLGLVLMLPQTSEAQRWGRGGGIGVGVGGGRSGGVWAGNRPYYGGYTGYGYNGLGLGYGNYGYGGYGNGGVGYSAYQPYGTYGSSGYYTSPGVYYSTPSFYGSSMPEYYSAGNPTQSYQSFYPPESGSGQGQGQDNRIHVKVDVPNPNAEVFFEGQRTQQTGTEREFVSPELSPGREYTYHLRARWMENGQMRDQTRAVRVRPGQWVAVDFARPDAGSTVNPGDDIRRDDRPRNPTPAVNPGAPLGNPPATSGGRPVTAPEAGRPLDQNPNSPVNPGTVTPRPGTPTNPNPLPGEPGRIQNPGIVNPANPATPGTVNPRPRDE